MLKTKLKKSISKRCFLNKNFIKIIHSSKNHLLFNKSKFSKKYLRRRFFLNKINNNLKKIF